MGKRLELLRLRAYASEVTRTTAVVVGVLAVLAALLLVAIAVSVLAHHGDKRRGPVMTVPAGR